jgi:O-antigen ligase
MKQILFPEDTLKNRISYYFIAGFLVLLPFERLLSEAVLICLCITTLLTIEIKRLRLLIDKRVIILTSFYLLGIVGMLYSPDIAEALNVSGRQLAIILFPILFLLNPINLGRYKLIFLKLFGITVACTILYLYIYAFYRIQTAHIPLQNLFSGDFMNHNFSLPIKLHATYLSMYAALAVTIFLYLFQQKGSLLTQIFYCCCIIIILGGMIQLSSRAAFIALFLVINIFFPLLLLRGKKRLTFISIAAIFSTLCLLSVYNISPLKNRYVGELKSDLGIDTMNVEFTEPRVVRWGAELELIKNSPVIGYGSGAEKKLLKEKFFEKHLYISYGQEFNSHSQYLSFLLNMGIVGLAGYLFVLCYAFWKAWKGKDIIFLGFLIIISLVSFSENILFLNKGIFFYGFFISLFVLSGKTKSVPDT